MNRQIFREQREIRRMVAGNELDELVADRIMDGVKASYSSNLLAAFQVAEKVKNKWMLDLEIRKNYDPAEEEYRVRFFGEYGEYISASDTKLSVAICKAALLAALQFPRVPETTFDYFAPDDILTILFGNYTFTRNEFVTERPGKDVEVLYLPSGRVGAIIIRNFKELLKNVEEV